VNKSVTEQWRQIEALGKQSNRMAARLQHVEDKRSPENWLSRAPHYWTGAARRASTALHGAGG